MSINPVSKELIKFTRKLLRNDIEFEKMKKVLREEQEAFFNLPREVIIKYVTDKEKKAALVYGQPIYPKSRIKKEKFSENIDDPGWYCVDLFQDFFRP